MARQSPGGSTPALTALTRAAAHFTVRAYDHDPEATSYGLEAADALGLEPDRVYKTLMVDAGGRLAVGVVPVSRSLDMKAMARALGAKLVQMADISAAERATGYVAGGISPFGQRRAHPTVIDSSVRSWETVFVSAGRRGLDVEVDVATLVDLTRGRVEEIAR